MTESRKVPVISRNGAGTFYQIPEDRIVRTFTHEEKKMIPLDELKKLQFVEGGEYVLKHCLIIDDKEALQELNLATEPEYFYTEDKIRQILLEGTLDELEDTLNFAPQGVISIIKKIGVGEELYDTRKRDLIFEKTGFNISASVDLNRMLNEEPKEGEGENAGKAVRKVSLNKDANTDSSAPVRKVSLKAE